MGKKLELIADKPERVTAFLSSSVAGLTRARADLLVKSGEVRVNGVRIKANASLSVGDRVKVFVPDEVQKNGLNANTVYEDDNIIVFDKPKRMTYDAIPQAYGAPLFAVHRLDTNTTGLIVFAKTQAALAQLEAAFRDRRVKKIYEAVVSPAPANDGETVTAYMRLLHGQNLAGVSAQPKSGYKSMITEYTVVERMGNAALLRVYPHTGRTHQIRAHLCFIGCPIVGEHKYGVKGGAAIDGAPDSQMLAAVELCFSGLKDGLEYLNGKTFKTGNGFDLDFLRGGKR